MTSVKIEFDSELDVEPWLLKMVVATVTPENALTPGTLSAAMMEWVRPYLQVVPFELTDSEPET